MHFRELFLFLFSLSVVYSFTISQTTSLPASMVAGMTYETQFVITSVGAFTTNFYLKLTGVNSSNEINASMDSAVCTYNSSVWSCLGYNKTTAGTYSTKMYIHLNELLDPAYNYTYSIDYTATENAPDTPAPRYFSSTGGGNYRRPPSLPSPPPVEPKPVVNETKPPAVPAQNTTKPPVVPPNQTIEPPAQNITPLVPVVAPPLLITPEEIQKAANGMPIELLIGITLLVLGAAVLVIFVVMKRKSNSKE